jgi:universal stress protein E
MSMNKPSFILVVVDREPDASGLVAKAVALARQTGARIELFLCESEQAYQLAHTYDRERVEEACAEITRQARAYLRNLRSCANAPDVDITIDARCESPLYEGIVRKVLRTSPDLVIKAAAGLDSRHHDTPDPNDWQLMRTCPATLLLTRGRAWRTPPRFAAAVDASEEETVSLPQGVMAAARMLATVWQARLEVMYGESGAAGEALPLRTDRLRRLCDATGIAPDRVHILYGQPEQTVLPFAKEQDYDVLILGALTHHPTDSVPLGTLTSQLLDALECDFVLVKPSSYRCPIENRISAETQRGVAPIGPGLRS